MPAITLQVVSGVGPPGPQGPQGPAGADGAGATGGGTSVDLTPYAPKASPALTGSPSLNGSPLLNRALADTYYDALGAAASVAASAAAAAIAAIPPGSSAANVASLRALGTAANNAAAGNDSRLSDSRTPLAHHATHQATGSDRIYDIAVSVPSASTAQALNMNNADVYVLTLTAASCALSFTNPPASGQVGSLRLLLVQDATGTRAVTWTGVTWVGGIAPALNTAAGAVTIVDIFTQDGGATYFGVSPQTPITGAAAALLTTVNRTAGWTLAATDFTDTVNEYNAAAAGVATIPLSPSPAISAGAIAEISQVGVGLLTVTPASGVTLLLPVGLTNVIRGKGSTAAIRCRATNSYLLSGDLANVPYIVRSSVIAGTGTSTSVPLVWTGATTPDGTSSVGKPKAGNLLLAVLFVQGTITTPTGWETLVGSATEATSSEKVAVYSKISDGTETGATFTIGSGTASGGGILIEVAGQNGAAPINGVLFTSDATDNAGTRTAPTLAPTSPFCLAFGIVGWGGSGSVPTIGAGSGGGTLVKASQMAWHSGGIVFKTLDASLAAPTLSVTTTDTSTWTHGVQATLLIAPS